MDDASLLRCETFISCKLRSVWDKMKLQQQSHATLKSKLQDHKTTPEWIKRMSGRVVVVVIVCDKQHWHQWENNGSYCGCSFTDWTNDSSVRTLIKQQRKAVDSPHSPWLQRKQAPLAFPLLRCSQTPFDFDMLSFLYILQVIDGLNWAADVIY